MSSEPHLRQIDFRSMRMVIGLLAFFVSPVVWFLAERTLDSISISYWTAAGDVFVGTLVAIAFFMFAYEGSSGRRDLEYWLSKISSFFALLIAFFPTSGFDDGGPYVPAWWASKVAGFLHVEVPTIHFTSAIIFFGCLTTVIFFFAGRAKEKGHPQRAIVYRTIGILIVAGIAAGTLAITVLDFEGALFYTEWWALAWFGTGWFLAGSYRAGDESDPDAGEA